jgi:hypothetical protein
MENVSIVIILEDVNAIATSKREVWDCWGGGVPPTHASAGTSSAKYITPNEDSLDVLGLNLLRQCYWERNNKNIFCRRLEKKIPRVKHLFSLDLNSQTCPVSDVMSAEIHINGIDTAYSVGECTFAEATINGNCLMLNYHTSFRAGAHVARYHLLGVGRKVQLGSELLVSSGRCCWGCRRYDRRLEGDHSMGWPSLV